VVSDSNMKGEFAFAARLVLESPVPRRQKGMEE
jgi:hypothetical protein